MWGIVDGDLTLRRLDIEANKTQNARRILELKRGSWFADPSRGLDYFYIIVNNLNISDVLSQASDELLKVGSSIIEAAGVIDQGVAKLNFVLRV